MSMDLLDALAEAWRECPPARRMIASYLGYEPPRRAADRAEELLSMFPNGVIK